MINTAQSLPSSYYACRDKEDTWFCLNDWKLSSDRDVDFLVMVSNHQSLSDSQRLKLGEIVDRCRLKLMRFAYAGRRWR